MTRVLLTIVLAAVLAACGGGGDDDATQPDEPPVEETAPGIADEEPYSDECGDAFADAATVDEIQDTNEDLYPAVKACANVEAFTAAAADHPDALDDVDPQTWLSNTCQYAEDPDVTGSDVCAEVSGS